MLSLSTDYFVSFTSLYLPLLFFLPIDQVKTYSNKLDMNAEGKDTLALSLATQN